MTPSLRPAAIAFDAIAPVFDSRFGAWRSVAAQRSAVRAALLREFSAGRRVLELGGGTGEDAMFLAKFGFDMLLTDPSPAMVANAKAKLAPMGARAEIVAGEELEEFAASYLSAGGTMFDGAFSNFAPLNCIADLGPVARGLARLLKPGAPAMLVLFGTFCPGEIATEMLRGRPARLRSLVCAGKTSGDWGDGAAQCSRTVDFAAAGTARGNGEARPSAFPSIGKPWRSCPLSISSNERLDNVMTISRHCSDTQARASEYA